MSRATYQDRLAQAHHPRRAPSSRYAAPAASVGSTLIPGLTTTVGDREDVLKELHDQFVGIQEDIFRAAGWRPDPGSTGQAHPVADEHDPIWRWWEEVARPTVEAWQAFYARQVESWWAKFRTDWSEYTRWQDRLLKLREAAKVELAKHGHRVSSPDPEEIPGTPVDLLRRLGRDLEDKARDTSGTLKIIGIGATLVAGAYVVHTLASAAKPSGR